MNIKVKNLVRRVAKGKLKKARFYAAFRVSQSPNFDYINEESGIPFLHTTFIFAAGNRQILGHLNGEAQEWENLVQMRDKILTTVERGDFFERIES